MALDAGARAYVEKLRTAAELIETVRKVLELPRSARRNGHGVRRTHGANGHAYLAANGNERPSAADEPDVDSRRPLDDRFDRGAPLG